MAGCESECKSREMSGIELDKGAYGPFVFLGGSAPQTPGSLGAQLMMTGEVCR